MVFGLIILVIVGLWFNYVIISDWIDRFKNRTQKFSYHQSGVEYIGKIERSYSQMLLNNAPTTIEIDGTAYTQTSGKKHGYNVTPGTHTISCYEGRKGERIGMETIRVNIPVGYVCKITYTASQLPGVMRGHIKYKIVQK